MKKNKQYIQKILGIALLLIALSIVQNVTAKDSSIIFMKNLQVGSRGEDVRRLQEYLNSHGFPLASSGLGSPAYETTYFGRKTKLALSSFQQHFFKEILIPIGLNYPTGNFNNSTRNFINASLLNLITYPALDFATQAAEPIIQFKNKPQANIDLQKNSQTQEKLFATSDVKAGFTPIHAYSISGGGSSSSPTSNYNIQTHTVGGNVSGLSGFIVLQNNGGNDLNINADGSFAFSAPIGEGSIYNVTILTQPVTQTCTVTNGSGTMVSNNMINVGVTCTTNTTTLSASISTLGLNVSGNARSITITNTGSNIAENLLINYPAWPSGTSANSTCGSTLNPADTCTITITPGATPSATPGDILPAPITLSISGDNTNTLSSTINIVMYGSVYQSGYVYEIDDTTPVTGGIGGKVVSLIDQATAFPSGVIWSSDSTGNYDGGVSIYGISETSTVLSPDPSSGQVSGQLACNGKIDGSSDTANIVAYYSPPTTNPQITSSYYAAGLCKATIGSYSDWYLPAICEMGSGSNGSGCTVGTPNIMDNVPSLIGTTSTDCIYGTNCLSGLYWSSTENSNSSQNSAWAEYFASGGGSFQGYAIKNTLLSARCSRALTP